MIQLTNSNEYGTAYEIDSSEEEEEKGFQNKKRKRTNKDSTSDYTTSARSKGGSKGGNNRASSKLQLELNAIQQRKNELEQWLNENNWQDTSSVDVTKCCLRCSISAYRQAVEENDEAKLEQLLKEKDTIPHWSHEERAIRDQNIFTLALTKGNSKIVNLLYDDQVGSRVKLSKNLTTYGSNTGYISRHTFGHAVR